MWEIIDSKSTIHSGTEDEMRTAFEIMIKSFDEFKADHEDLTEDQINDLCQEYGTCWIGDLRLIEVHNTYR